MDNSDAGETEPKVLVTNDLTWQVGMDAIEQGVSIIVSYREFVFFMTQSD